MSDKTIYLLHANICKALANPIRIEVIEILGERELSFSEIQEATGILKSNLSQHLSILVSNGIIHQRRDGQYMFFKISSSKIVQACRMMREVLIENISNKSNALKVNQ